MPRVLRYLFIGGASPGDASCVYTRSSSYTTDESAIAGVLPDEHTITQGGRVVWKREDASRRLSLPMPDSSPLDHLDFLEQVVSFAVASPGVRDDAMFAIERIREVLQDLEPEEESEPRHPYVVLGTTYDGVKILEPIGRSENFEPGEIRELVARALRELDTRECTCHPDDDPPRPCPKRFALSECREAAARGE